MCSSWGRKKDQRLRSQGYELCCRRGMQLYMTAEVVRFTTAVKRGRSRYDVGRCFRRAPRRVPASARPDATPSWRRWWSAADSSRAGRSTRSSSSSTRSAVSSTTRDGSTTSASCWCSPTAASTRSSTPPSTASSRRPSSACCRDRPSIQRCSSAASPDDRLRIDVPPTAFQTENITLSLTLTAFVTTRSTQPCILLGSLNRVPALIGWGKGGNVTSAGWQVTLCDPIWHVSSRSGAVLVAQTAIRFLIR